jgi:hypothetical protein
MALVLGGGYLVVGLLGWREFTTVLSGTFPTGDQVADGLRGTVYLLFHFGCLVAAPILVIAAGLDALAGRRCMPPLPPPGNRTSQKKSFPPSQRSRCCGEKQHL